MKASLATVGRIGATAGQVSPRSEEVLDWLLRNGRRERLCAEVERVSGAPHSLVEDALQEACLHAATTGKCRGTTEGQVYNWLLTTTVRRVSKLRTRAHFRREVPVEWIGDDGPRIGTSTPVDEELLEREKAVEIAECVRTVCAHLNERQRQVAALHSRRLAGREIAERLGISERRVKHLKAETFARARQVLVEASGGGCEEGERMVSRFSFGLASATERTAAQLHLSGCERCTTLFQRLELVHENVAALLPIPAAVGADPGLVERLLQWSGDTLVQAKQQLATVSSHAKQHAVAGYTRTAEYTPLATVRPGAAATAVAGCLALGGGAAGYCIDRGVNPITGFVDIVQPGPAKRAQADLPEDPTGQQQPPDPPQLPTTSPEAPSSPAPTQLQPTTTVEAEPALPPPPPPEQEQFDPAAAAAAEAPPQPSPAQQQPAAAPDTGVGEFLAGP